MNMHSKKDTLNPDHNMPSKREEVPCLNYFYTDRETQEPRLLHIHPTRDTDLIHGINTNNHFSKYFK